MTRINIIPPSELNDQHLIAEYREILMIPGSLKRTLKSKNGIQKNKIPKKFTLNSGHIYFFYDKGLYLYFRYFELRKEMLFRGFKIDPYRKFPLYIFPKDCRNNWIPSEQERNVVRERIKLRIKQRSNWYRKTLNNGTRIVL